MPSSSLTQPIDIAKARRLWSQQMKPFELSYSNGCEAAAKSKFEIAVQQYDVAIALKPDYHEAWYNRGIALVELGRREDAIASYEAAVAIKSDKHEAWYNRGIELVALGRYGEAVTSYGQALVTKPDKHEAWYNRACAHALNGQADEALRDLQQALELSECEYRSLAKSDSDFASLKADERFKALLVGQAIKIE